VVKALGYHASDRWFQFRLGIAITGCASSPPHFDEYLHVGLPAYQQKHLASVLNAAARLVYRLRRYDHFTDALATLHWLRLPERVDIKMAVMAYRVLYGLAPSYLSQLIRTADLPGRRRLRSSSTHSLLVPSFRRSTVGRRSFPVAASVLWNSLPLDTQSSPSLTVFRQLLKTCLFRKLFSHILL